MALKTITYKHDGKTKRIKVKVCKNMWSQGFGMMFKKNPDPHFFVFKKEIYLPIFSLFCVPFRALWLDEDMRVVRVVDVKGPKLHISGRGRYLLEIPLKRLVK